MNKTKAVIYPDEAFNNASNSFKISTKAFSIKLEKLNADDFLPRYNRITILLEYNNQYTYPILFLKVYRIGSSLGLENFYSFPLNIEQLSLSCKYEIDFLHFDAFNLQFDSVEVTTISKNDYLKRQLNGNAVERAKKETIGIRKKN